MKPQYHHFQNNNQDQGGKQQSDIIATPRATFKVECPELEGDYFDFYTGYRVDMYKTSVRLISGYIANKYDNGDGIKMILNKLKIPTLKNPKALGSMADGVEKYIYR